MNLNVLVHLVCNDRKTASVQSESRVYLAEMAIQHVQKTKINFVQFEPANAITTHVDVNKVSVIIYKEPVMITRPNLRNQSR